MNETLELLLLPFQLPFMLSAFAVTLMIAVPMALLSCFLVLKGWALMGDAIAHAVFPGVVQAPPDGQPIILLADAQTTGGYPCLATVIQADLWKLAQARPGAHLHFVPCSAEDARAALARQVREGQRLRHALRTLTE